jgi:hypothetical protein
MAVNITKTTGESAEITWKKSDDPHGWIASAIEGNGLAHALEALGDGEAERDTTRPLDIVRQAAFHTNKLAGLLERRAAVQVVRLRDDHGLSWRQIAETIHQDPDKQSTVRRQYDSGRRHLGR